MRRLHILGIGLLIIAAIEGALLFSGRVQAAAPAQPQITGELQDAEELVVEQEAPARQVQRPAVPAASGRGLCGTEIEPLAEEPSLETPRVLRALGAGIPSLAELREAAEAQGFPVEEFEVIALAESAQTERASEERELAEREQELARLADAPAQDRDPAAIAYAERARSLVLQGLGRPEEALKAAEVAHQLEPTLVTVERLGDALTSLGRRQEARQLLTKALASTEDSEERAWYQYGIGFLCSGHDEQCADQAERSLGELLKEDDPVSLRASLRGIRAGDQGDYAAAKEAFLEDSDENPQFATQAGLAAVVTNLGQVEEAKQRWTKAMDVASNSGERAAVIEGLGSAHLEEGDTVSAWMAGAAALAVTGSSAHSSGARGLLALTALNIGDLEEARGQITRSREANPNDDMNQFYWYANEAERSSMRALVAEASGDLETAREAWLTVARTGHPKLSVPAKVALGKLCRHG